MEVSELLELARSRASDPENPLAILSAAIVLCSEPGGEPGNEADALLDLVVRRAREAGVPWTAIAERFGYTRRTPRRRFTPAFAHRHLVNRRIRRDAACSFCRRPPGPRVHMVHGEGGRICDRCVALARDIVAGLARRR